MTVVVGTLGFKVLDVLFIEYRGIDLLDGVFIEGSIGIEEFVFGAVLVEGLGDEEGLEFIPEERFARDLISIELE